jgi:peptidoglycan hydrolase FlgJ
MSTQALSPFATSLMAGAGSALASSASASLRGTLDGRAHGADRTRKTAQDFERMFLEQTMDRVNGSEGTEGPLGENGTGGGIYRSMMNKEYANAIVKTGGVGIADQVYKQMLAMQGATNGATDAARG